MKSNRGPLNELHDLTHDTAATSGDLQSQLQTMIKLHMFLGGSEGFEGHRRRGSKGIGGEVNGTGGNHSAL